MENLAGNYNCNLIIADKLAIAKIPVRVMPVVIYHEPHTTFQMHGQMIPKLTFRQIIPLSYEVPSAYYGRIGRWTFKRSWYYWVVSGGKMPLDRAWSIYRDPVGKRDVRAFGHCGCVEPTWASTDYVDCYHVDSQDGLDLIARYIKELKRIEIERR